MAKSIVILTLIYDIAKRLIYQGRGFVPKILTFSTIDPFLAVLNP